MRGGARPARSSGRRRATRVLVAIGALIGVLGAGSLADLALLAARLHHVRVNFPQPTEGATWIVVGSDSRSAVPSGPNRYGSVLQAPGSHADAVLVVHRGPLGLRVISVPRDVLVSPRPGVVERLTLTFGRGPQELVNGLCRTLDIPATRLLIVDMRAFAGVTDILGGVTVTNPAPVRDNYSGLYIAKAGRVHLDGVDALALVRSRQPQVLGPSGWTAVSPTVGDDDRTRWIGVVFKSLEARAWSDRWNPFRMQRLAWTALGGLTTDDGTGLFQLPGILHGGAVVESLPVRPLATNGVGAAADAATFRTLTDSGFSRSCTPARA